jgi:hypothetical protein
VLSGSSPFRHEYFICSKILWCNTFSHSCKHFRQDWMPHHPPPFQYIGGAHRLHPSMCCTPANCELWRVEWGNTFLPSFGTCVHFLLCSDV